MKTRTLLKYKKYNYDKRALKKTRESKFERIKADRRTRGRKTEVMLHKLQRRLFLANYQPARRKNLVQQLLFATASLLHFELEKKWKSLNSNQARLRDNLSNLLQLLESIPLLSIIPILLLKVMPSLLRLI